MIRLQAKHFGFDVKNKLNKVSLEHTKQKNAIFENIKKQELSLNDPGSTFKIKTQKHLEEVSHHLDKLNELDSRVPRGLKTINKNRQPYVETKN